MSMSSLLAFCVDRLHCSIAKSLPASVCPAWHILNVTHQEHHRDAASICIGASAQVPTYLYKNVPAVDYSASDMGAEYCDEHVCVCLSVRDHIFGTTRHARSSPNFLYMLPMAEARSSSVGVVICYVLPVLWMTSYLLISQCCSTSPPS